MEPINPVSEVEKRRQFLQSCQRIIMQEMDAAIMELENEGIAMVLDHDQPYEKILKKISLRAVATLVGKKGKQ